MSENAVRSLLTLKMDVEAALPRSRNQEENIIKCFQTIKNTMLEMDGRGFKAWKVRRRVKKRLRESLQNALLELEEGDIWKVEANIKEALKLIDALIKDKGVCLI